MASIILASLTSGAAFSEDVEKNFAVRMSMDSKIKIPSWDVINSIYGEWSNVGSPQSCQEWGAPTGTVTLGDTFQQSRICQQSQSRTITPVLQNSVLKTTKNGTPTSIQRDVSITEFREAVGTGDSIVSERLGEYSDWARDSLNYDCGAWSPSADEEPLYEPFTQSRTCSKNEIRSRDVFHVWSSGKETFKNTETDSRVTQEVEAEEAVGTKDYVYLMRPDAWSEWENVGGLYECSAWLPSVDDVNMGSNLEQSRGCLQLQKSSRDLYLVWRSGPEFLYKTEEREKDIFVEQSQQAEGVRDYIASSTAGDWSAWSNDGVETGCGGWSPSTATVNFGESFTQSRSCDQDQVRTRTIYDVWQSGKTTVNTTETSEQSITLTQTQPAVGVKDYKTGEISYGEYSDWKNSGNPSSCEEWSPSTSSVDLGVEFTQERGCKQSQSRQRTIYDVWASGRETSNSTQGNGRTIDVIQSQPAVGEKAVIVSSESTTGAWSYTGNETCGNWSPTVSSINYGTSFTQSQSCSRPRARAITSYNVFSDGSKTVKGTSTETDIYQYSNSATATGTKDYVVSSGWNNNYSITERDWECEAYSPSVFTVADGVKFTQTKECTQLIETNKRYYETWRVAGQLYIGSESVYSTITNYNTESRDNWGAKLDCGSGDSGAGSLEHCN